VSSLLEQRFCAVLNRLLAVESWARERLRPHAGCTVQFELSPGPSLWLRVGEEGFVEAALPVTEPDLRLRLGPGAFVAFLRGEEHFLRSVERSGSEALALAIAQLVRHLRWDWEEELAGLVGDPAAHAFAQALRRLQAEVRDAAARATASLAEHAAGDGQLILGRPEFERLRESVGRLREGLERLEKRIERLEG